MDWFEADQILIGFVVVLQFSTNNAVPSHLSPRWIIQTGWSHQFPSLYALLSQSDSGLICFMGTDSRKIFVWIKRSAKKKVWVQKTTKGFLDFLPVLRSRVSLLKLVSGFCDGPVNKNLPVSGVVTAFVNQWRYQLACILESWAAAVPNLVGCRLVVSTWHPFPQSHPPQCSTVVITLFSLHPLEFWCCPCLQGGTTAC